MPFSVRPDRASEKRSTKWRPRSAAIFFVARTYRARDGLWCEMSGRNSLTGLSKGVGVTSATWSACFRNPSISALYADSNDSSPSVPAIDSSLPYCAMTTVAPTRSSWASQSPKPSSRQRSSAEPCRKTVSASQERSRKVGRASANASVRMVSRKARPLQIRHVGAAGEHHHVPFPQGQPRRRLRAARQEHGRQEHGQRKQGAGRRSHDSGTPSRYQRGSGRTESRREPPGARPAGRATRGARGEESVSHRRTPTSWADRRRFGAS